MAAAVREQDHFLDEALTAKRFWHLWNTRQSEETLRGVYRALTEAFGLGMHTAAVQVQPSCALLPSGASQAPLLWVRPDSQSRQNPASSIPPSPPLPLFPCSSHACHPVKECGSQGKEQPLAGAAVPRVGQACVNGRVAGDNRVFIVLRCD